MGVSKGKFPLTLHQDHHDVALHLELYFRHRLSLEDQPLEYCHRHNRHWSKDLLLVNLFYYFSCVHTPFIGSVCISEKNMYRY